MYIFHLKLVFLLLECLLSPTNQKKALILTVCCDEPKLPTIQALVKIALIKYNTNYYVHHTLLLIVPSPYWLLYWFCLCRMVVQSQKNRSYWTRSDGWRPRCTQEKRPLITARRNSRKSRRKTSRSRRNSIMWSLCWRLRWGGEGMGAGEGDSQMQEKERFQRRLTLNM